MNSTSPQYITPNDGEKGVLRAPFIMQSFYCLNLSDKWVYVSPGSSGSTSVNNVLYSHVLPPFSEGILPSVGEYLAYLVSNDAAFNITATVGQDSGDARVVFIMYDYPFTMPVHALPGTTIAAELVSGDLQVNRLHALIAASIGAGVVDDTIKLLITPNATTEAGIKFQGLAAQSGKPIEVLDSGGGIDFDVDAGGNVHIGTLTSGRVVIAGTAGLLTDDADLVFSGTRLTVTDLTVTNAPIISSLTAGRVLIAGASKEIVDDADLSFSGTRLTVTDLTVTNSPIISALTSGRVGIVGASKEITDDAGLTYDAGTNTLTAGVLRVSNLTATRIPFIAAAGNELTDSSALVWLTGVPTLQVTGAVSATNVAVSSLTNGRVALVGASSLLVDDADLTFSGSTLTGTAIRSNSATGGIGYSTGAGGAVTQATNKSTGVTLNTMSGQITTANVALAAGALVSFVLTNSNIAVTDVVIAHVSTGGTSAGYRCGVMNTGAGAVRIFLTNVTAGSLTEPVVINFAILKGVAA